MNHHSELARYIFISPSTEMRAEQNAEAPCVSGACNGECGAFLEQGDIQSVGQ